GGDREWYGNAAAGFGTVERRFSSGAGDFGDVCGISCKHGDVWDGGGDPNGGDGWEMGGRARGEGVGRVVGSRDQSGEGVDLHPGDVQGSGGGVVFAGGVCVSFCGDGESLGKRPASLRPEREKSQLASRLKKRGPPPLILTAQAEGGPDNG